MKLKTLLLSYFLSGFKKLQKRSAASVFSVLSCFDSCYGWSKIKFFFSILRLVLYLHRFGYEYEMKKQGWYTRMKANTHTHTYYTSHYIQNFTLIQLQKSLIFIFVLHFYSSPFLVCNANTFTIFSLTYSAHNVYMNDFTVAAQK